MMGYLFGHRYSSMLRTLQAHYIPDDMPDTSETERLAILRALEKRDSKAARQAMKAHIDRVIAIFGRTDTDESSFGRD